MKNFTDLYEEVLRNSKGELEYYRKMYLIKVSLIFLIGILSLMICLCLQNENISLISLGISVIMFLIVFSYKPGKKYKEIYKEKIVKNFIKVYDENLEYKPESGIQSSIYCEAGFETQYNRYHTEDLIIGNIDSHNIQLAEVHTEEEHKCESDDGTLITSCETLFYGMFGYIEINNIYNGEMKIHSDKGKLGRLFGNKKRVEMDSTEFEKYFDVYADDKIQAMQVLTSDIMEKMIDFRTDSKTKFEITINRDKLYIRFHTGSMFEANVFRSSVNFNTLKKVYDIINFTLDITREFIKVSEETEI